MDALLNLDAVEKSGSVERLRNLVDKVETQVRSLRALGVESTRHLWHSPVIGHLE